MNNYKVTIEYEAFIKAHDKNEAKEKWVSQEWSEDNNEFLHKLLDTTVVTEQEKFGLSDEEKKEIQELFKGL